MFKFTRSNTDYEIKYVNFGDDDMLVCQYEDAGNVRYRAMQDTYDLTFVHGKWYDDEKEFLQAFLVNLNDSLDKAHDDTEEPSSSPQEKLTALIENSLSFNGKHVVIH